jgi:Flp pilus assembly protein TadG
MSQTDEGCLRGPWRPVAVRCSGLDGESGNALVELALVFALFGIPMLLGTVEMGYVVYDSVEISNAANAGALYGMQNATSAASSAGITTAAQGEAPEFGTKLTVTPTTFYVCTSAVGGTQYSTASYTQAQVTAKCAGSGNHALEFIQVLTSATATPPVQCPGLAKTFTLGGTSVMEVEK